MSLMQAYDRDYRFDCEGRISPKRVSKFKASKAIRERVADLIARSKLDGLTKDETNELQSYLQLEHLMVIAKAKARARVKRGARKAE